MQDAARKDRLATPIEKIKGHKEFGTNNPAAKLSPEAVKEIKQHLRKGKKHRVIAEKYGVSKSLITKINTGKYWKDI